MTERPLNQAEQQLRDYLEMIRRVRRLNPQPEGYPYHGPEDFILQVGQWFDVRPFPAEMPEGVPRYCYNNAARLAKARGLRYIEGYALHVIAVSHAWNADAEGKLIDTTWRNEGAAYIGVEFEVEAVSRVVLKNHGTMLEDWEGEFQILRKPYRGLERRKEPK